MEKTNTPENAEVAEFDLKHRITGAAVLLFFGALVLPWLLGPPSVASKADGVDGVDGVDGNESSLVGGAEIEAIELDGGEQLGGVEIAETVYISKITPLDVQTDKQQAAVEDGAVDVAVKVTPVADKVEPKNTKEASADASESDSKRKKDAENAKKKELADAEKEKKEAELAKAKANKEKREKEQREKELQAQLAAEASGSEAKASAVDVGWVVQVGLFTEKSRALALVSELKNKGFTASNSVVDTNRGPKTGTRVWLGPFAKRSAAQTEQKRLKSKAGKDGFIRVYP